MEESTVKTIMDKLAELAAEKRTIGPQTWMDAASKLNVLLQSEVEDVIDRKLTIAKLRAAYMADGKTAAYARAQVEAMPEWAELQKQQALVDRAKEMILLAKKNATLASELMRHQLA
jgi:hypothetical protein